MKKEPNNIEEAQQHFEILWGSMTPLPFCFQWLAPMLKRYAHYFFDCGYFYGRGK